MTTPKRPRDTNQLAKMVVDIAAGQPDTKALEDTPSRRGGLKGGRARALLLSEEERHGIAKKAAAARWNKRDD